MNPIDRILSEVTEDQLRAMVSEMDVMNSTTVLPDGEVKRLTAKIVDEIGMPREQAADIVQKSAYRLAARRWTALATPTATTEFIGLKSRKTGELARVHTSDENRSDSYFLSADPAHPYFQAQSEGQIRRVLIAPTPYYNATNDQPGWGDFEGSDLVPVRVRLSATIGELAMEPAITVRTVHVRDIHAKVARGYAGREIVTDGQGSFVFWLAHRPDGQSLEAMKSLEGKNVYSEQDALTFRKVYAVCEVPEEWVPELKGKPGALLIASEHRYDD
ncbi:hypothetical protein ABIC83_002830 [Roseateles asaccharophilus]|uniref:hypothetical protein n=1 Tax=Roseateles asaccharophilus TaxID=582607 RepID=UPI003835D2CF